MVNKYNEKAAKLELGQCMHGTVGDLLDEGSRSSPPLNGPEFHNFDLAAVGMAFHHLAEPPILLQQLKKRLRPENGVCLVIDHARMYSETHMRAMFEEAGLGRDFRYKILEEPMVVKSQGWSSILFMARGQVENGAQ